MLHDIINGNLPFLPNLFSGWQLTNQQMLIIALFTAAASYVLVRVASGVKVITLPICFSSLFICAMFANWFFKDFHIVGISEIQKTLIFTVLGQAIASLILLFGFRSERI